MAEHHLSTPICEEEVRKLKVGDIVYLSGIVITARDAAHKRVLEYLKAGKPLPVDFHGMAIYHLGPIVKKEPEGWKIISAGPTTSARLEIYEAGFIEKTGVRLIIGKGGMGHKTAEACEKFGAAYAIFPGGAGALAARMIIKVERVEWLDLGVPEALWTLHVRDFGPLLVIIDSAGRNFYENVKEHVEGNLEKAYSIICSSSL